MAEAALAASRLAEESALHAQHLIEDSHLCDSAHHKLNLLAWQGSMCSPCLLALAAVVLLAVLETVAAALAKAVVMGVVMVVVVVAAAEMEAEGVAK